MKKIYVAMAVLGTVLLSSCVQEKNFKHIKVGENELAFVMQGVSTRWRTPGQLIDQGTALGLRPQKFLLASVVGQWAQGPGLVNEENERLEDQMPSY